MDYSKNCGIASDAFLSSSARRQRDMRNIIEIHRGKDNSKEPNIGICYNFIRLFGNSLTRGISGRLHIYLS